MTKEIYDLIIIGRGPVGLTAAAVAAQLGMRTAIIERHRDMYKLPRAGHLDHEIVRLLQSVDAAEKMLADSYPTVEYVWVNAAREKLMEFDWGAKGISGYNSDYMQFQPVFETALGARIAASEDVDEYVGWEAQDFAEVGDAVELRIARTTVVPGQPRPVATDETTTLRGRYLVAADGANSAMRNRLGIERDDFGFNEKWLVVDARKKRDLTFDFDCGQICDPRRPVTILPLGRRHRRWEWALLPGETPADLEQPEKAWEFLAEQGIGRDDVEIIRQLVYTFEARHAKSWRRGRIFLMGDAVHTMPPFMGQGMCSGMRDAKNLVWKLDLVRRGIADASLLDTYELERSPHTRDWTLISLEAGKVPCTLDHEEARQRDERFRNGWMPPMPDFPQLRDGVLAPEGFAGVDGLAGTLGLQGRVDRGGRTELFDAFFPSTGFTVVSTVGDPARVLSDRHRAALARIGCHLVHVGEGGQVADVDGSYAAHFAEHGVEVVVNRPDFYVFGAATRLADLPALVDLLLARIGYIDEEAEAVAAERDIHVD